MLSSYQTCTRMMTNSLLESNAMGFPFIGSQCQTFEWNVYMQQQLVWWRAFNFWGLYENSSQSHITWFYGRGLSESIFFLKEAMLCSILSFCFQETLITLLIIFMNHAQLAFLILWQQLSFQSLHLLMAISYFLLTMHNCEGNSMPFF